jgi:hypothetical protein
MFHDAAYFRQKAEDCRRVSAASARPNFYLLELAKSLDRTAEAIELRFAGSKPTKEEKPRR